MTESLHDMQNKHWSTKVLEEISLIFYHHIARLSSLIQEYIFLVKR